MEIPADGILCRNGYVLLDPPCIDASGLITGAHNHGPEHFKYIPKGLYWVEWVPAMALGPFGVIVSSATDKAGTHSLQDVVVVSGCRGCLLDLSLVDRDGLSVGIATVTNGVVRKARHVSSVFQVSREALPSRVRSGVADGWMTIANILVAYHARNDARKRACVYTASKVWPSFRPDESGYHESRTRIGEVLAHGLMYGSDGADFQSLLDDGIRFHIEGTTAASTQATPKWFIEASRERMQFPSVRALYGATVGRHAAIRVIPGMEFPCKEGPEVCIGEVRVLYRNSGKCTVCTAFVSSPSVWFEVATCSADSATCYDCFDKQFGRWKRVGIFRCYAIDVVDWMSSHIIDWAHLRAYGRMPLIADGNVYLDETTMKSGLIGATYRLLLEAQQRILERTESRLAMARHGVNLDNQEMIARKRASSNFDGDLILAPCVANMDAAATTSTNAKRLDLMTIIAGSAFDQNPLTATVSIRGQIERAKRAIAADQAVPERTRRDRSKEVEKLRRFIDPRVGLKYPVSGCASRATRESDKIKCVFVGDDGAVLSTGIRVARCMQHMGLLHDPALGGRATPVTLARMKAADRHLEIRMDKMLMPE